VTESTDDAIPSPAASPPRRLDALGAVSLGLYMVVGGVFVFGFGRSLPSAVQTQNETPCRSLQPYQARVTGVVLDDAGKPAAGAVVVPVVDSRSMMPIPVDPEDGSFTTFMPKGPQALRIRAPGKETLEAGFVVGPSELIDVKVGLTKEGVEGSFEEVSRQPWVAPDFEVQDLEGNVVSLSSLRGQLVVLNFWATWCEPCVTEWPQVAKLAARVAEDEDAKVAVVAVSIDGERDAIGPFLGRMALGESEVQVLWDETTKLHTRFGSDKIPDTFFIDEQGMVEAVFVNTREWGSPDALHCLESSVGR